MLEASRRRRVCVVVTARPSYSRVRSVLFALQERGDVELQLVVSASALLDRYGNVAQVIERDGFSIAARVYNVIEGETPITSAKTTGLAIVELAGVFDMLEPDVVVTIADRFETLGTAVAASYINLPVAHIQGGEVTGSIDEKVRHAVTKLSDIHFASTKLAAERIVRLGERAEAVHFTGCPSIDIAAQIKRSQAAAFDPFKSYGGVGPIPRLDEEFIIVMQHPVPTEFEAAGEQIEETLEAISGLDTNAFWFWPNVDAGSDAVSKKIRTYREKGRLQRVHFFRNLNPEDFLKLMLRSRCIVGNSSVSVREGSYLGVPAVNVGSRQRFRERGANVIDADYDWRDIQRAVKVQHQHGPYEPDTLYGDGTAGEKIAGLLATAELRFDKVLTYVQDGR